MNRFSTARGNAPAPVTVTGSASFRSARAESRRAAARSARPPALPAVRRTDRAGDDRTAEGAGSLRTAFGSALFAMPVAAVAGLIFLLIAAGTVCAMPDPDSLITPLGLSVLGLTVLCGGLSVRAAPGAPRCCAGCCSAVWQCWFCFWARSASGMRAGKHCPWGFRPVPVPGCMLHWSPYPALAL